MNILLTGTKGFLGRHLIDYLDWTSLHNLYEYELPDNNFTNKHQLEDFIKLHDINIIIHVGAMAGLAQCMDLPTKAVHTNVFGTSVLLEMALKYNCKFLHTSTWAVNGCLEHPYDITKKAAEDLVMMYHKLYGLDTMILRMATMYGPRMRPNGVIYAFLNNKLRKKSNIIQGDGEQFRQFLYVDDAVKAFKRALQHWKSGAIYEVQGDEKVQIIDIARIVDPTLKQTVFTEARLGDEHSFMV